MTIWVNSGDSHLFEPEDLYTSNMPAALAERMPRTVTQDGIQTTYIDGKTITRRAPGPNQVEMNEAIRRPPGAHSAAARMKDLDDQGVWGEVLYPSLGLWYGEIDSVDLAREAARVLNDFVADEFLRHSNRLVPTATLPLQSMEESCKELARCAELGFKAVFLPTTPPPQNGLYNDERWEPLWDLAEETGVVLGVHIGSDAGERNQKYKGPGGAIINYVETTFGGQRATVQIVASGVLERHPDLKLLISEGGAAWVPFIGDRMDEAYRQLPLFRDGKLSMKPKDYLNRQVYASFQHDETAIPALTAMGYKNVVFGTDYPHMEGTFPDTQKIVSELFEGVDEKVRQRITIDTFLELFPHVGRPPAEAAA